MSLAAARQQFPHLRDYTDQELLGIVAQSNNIAPGSQQFKKLESDLLGYNRTAGEMAKDAAVGLGQGLTGLAKAVGVVRGAIMPGESAFNNETYNYWNDVGQNLNASKSAGLRNQEAGAAVRSDIAEREAQARGDGVVGRFASGAAAQLENYATNPGTIVQDLVSNSPQLLAGGVAGRAVQIGGSALGLGANAAARAGVAAGVGSGGVLQGADVGGETYQRARAAGATHEQASAAANEAALKSGAASVVLSTLPGAATIERSMLRGAVTPNRFGLGRVGTVARVGATEGFTEAADEGYGQFAGNQGVRTVDGNVDLMSGVGGAAVQGAAVGGPMGAFAGARTSEAPARPAAAPRTETGEINLGATEPTADLDVPTYQRRGLDPMNTPWQNPQGSGIDYTAPEAPAPAPSTLELGEHQPVRYGNEIEFERTPPAAPDLGFNDYQTPLPDNRAPAKRPYQAGGVPIVGEQQQDTSLPRDVILGATPGVNPRGPVGVTGTAEDLIRNQEANRAIESAPAPQLILPTQRSSARPRPAASEVEAAPAKPNVGKVLAALQAASAEVGRSTTRKDGSLSNARGNAPLRAVMEAADPLAAMRGLYKDGADTRDELLDIWHEKLTGQSISDWKATQNQEVNSAGFVAEPAAQVQAQLNAVRDGRKAVAVIGEQEAINAELEGLVTGRAQGPDGATAVVVSQDPARVEQAVTRASEVGLKQAMGEALNYANPALTTETAPNAQVLQQVDNASGQVVDEQVVTPADMPNVTQVAGTTARVVPVAQALNERRAATAKPPKYGRRPSVELVRIAEDTKDETQYREARYELYRRWANDNDDGIAAEYLTDKANKSNLSKEEEVSFGQRYAAELEAKGTKRAQALGKKFGADDGGTTALSTGGPVNPDNGTHPLTAADVAGITNAAGAVKWLQDNAADTWHRDIAKRLAPYLDDKVGVHFVKEGDVLPSLVARHLNGEAMAVLHLLGDQTNAYYRTDKTFNETTLLHEMVHAATMRALTGNQNVAFRNEMRSLLKTIKQSFREAAATNSNGAEASFFDKVLTDENELLAYAYSSPSMRRWMQNMDANGRFVQRAANAAELRRKAERRAPGVPPLTMWQKFTDAIRKLFGIAPVNQLAFERMLADREADIAGVVESGKDTELYNRLDEMLQQAMDLQAAQREPVGEAVADSAESVNGSPLLRPFSQAVKSTAAYVKAQTSGQEISPTLLSMMTLRQIDEQFGKKLPAMRDWIGAIMQRSSSAAKLAAEADRVALQWEKSVKNPAERKALADILLRASVAELSLDETGGEYTATLSADQRKEYNELRSKLAALSPEAQQVRKQALDILRRQWEYTRDSLEKFINHTVPEPGLRNQRIADLKNEMGRNRGDYFPLSRFGDRVVVGRGAAADGRDVVSFHESVASADAEVKRLKDAGVKRVDVTLQTARDPRQRASTGFMGSLHEMIDGSDADPATKDSMHEALQQLFLKSLPELSGAKHMIRRENVEGFSEDAMRVFADAVTRGSRYASHLEFAPQIQAAMESAEAQSRSSDKRTAAVVIGRKEDADPVVRVVPAGTDRLNAVNQLAEQGYDTEFFNTVPETAQERLAGKLEGATPEQLAEYVKQVEGVVGRTEEGVEDMRAAKALYNHMVNTQKTEANQDPSAVVEALGQAGYTWFLGFSPAFWAMNSLQNPMIGIPHLGAKYGVGKAAAEWMGAAKWFGGVRMGKLMSDSKTPFSVEWLKQAMKDGNLKGVTKQELDMLQELEDHQVLDFTQAMDLSRIGQASSDKRYKFMRLAAAGAHHTEVFNRVTFALAAYRLALKSSGNVSHKEAVRRAENDTAAVHFDYSFANKPELMRGKGASRLVFMFQQYRQHMLYWWAKNIKDMVKNESPGDRARAMKAALLMGTTQGIFAGALGMPFVGAVAFLANMLGGDDDDGEPFDFNRWITEAAVDATGSKAAGEVMAKGIFAALGLNISQRIGQADLLPFLNEGSSKFERNADDKMRAYLFDLLGPLGSIALGAARASEAFARGDTLGGLAATTPKAVADIVKAYQLETEGMKDKRGQFIATAEAFDGADVFMQAAGVAPTKVANIKADRSRIMDVDNALKDKSRQITGRFTEAWMRGDREGVMEAVNEVKAFNQKLASKKLADKSTMIDGRQLESAIKDRRQRAMLLALTGGTAETRRQLLLATRMSGLFNEVNADTIRGNMANLPGLPGLPNGDD